MPPASVLTTMFPGVLPMDSTAVAIPLVSVVFTVDEEPPKLASLPGWLEMEKVQVCPATGAPLVSRTVQVTLTFDPAAAVGESTEVDTEPIGGGY
jgi:hypothetical protein